MLEDFGAMISAVVQLFKTELTLYGVTFSFWEIFLFTAVVGIVAYFLGGAFGGD